MTAGRCNVCGGVLGAGFADVRDPQTGDVFAIQSCTSCGLGHTSPQPGNLDSYYGAAYYGDRHSVTKRFRAWRRWHMVQRAAKNVGTGSRKPKLLDLGCGEGSFLELAKENGWSVAGTELGANAARARSLGIEVQESLDAISAFGPFDVITMWHSLEHFRDPRATFDRVHDMLAPGGLFVVAVPDAGGLQATVFRERWFHLDVPRHLFHFTQRSLEQLMNAAGFKVDSWRHQEIEQDLAGWLQSALNSVFPTPNLLYDLLSGKAFSRGVGRR
jgi:SAM-dependent methyltransferase